MPAPPRLPSHLVRRHRGVDRARRHRGQEAEQTDRDISDAITGAFRDEGVPL